MVVFLLQRTLVGLCRDIRGLAFAFNSKSSYMMLFDWMYPLYCIGYCDFQLSEAREVWRKNRVVVTGNWLRFQGQRVVKPLLAGSHV